MSIPASADKTIGVIGGMGPEATLDFMQRVISLTPATDDNDHLRMLVDNNPKVPSRILRLLDGDGPDPEPVLCDMARGLEVGGADFLVMPCNTAHHYHPGVQAAVDIPFLDMPELAIAHIRSRFVADAGARVGLLASSVLSRIRLYEPYVDAAGLTLIYPDQTEQEALMALIRAVKAGQVTPEALDAFNAAALSVQGKGAEVILLACTELSAVAGAMSAQEPLVQLPFVDASQILAEAAVALARADD